MDTDNKIFNWRHLLSVALVLIFSFSLVGLSVIKSSQARDQSVISVESANPSVPVVVVASPKTTVDYYLSYPGILPDHPLYWVKMLRDRLLLWLTQDRASKIEKIVTYADKRIGAAQVLIEGGKVQLGITTATKAEKYLEQAVSEYNKWDTQQAKPEIKEKITKAIAKHEEVLTLLIAKTDNGPKEILEQLITKLKQLVIK